MSSVVIEHHPSPMKLEVLGVDDWQVCKHAVSVQEKSYAQTETTFIIAGRAEITPRHGETVVINAGDLVTFLPDAQCTWNITEAIERCYCTG